MLVRRFFNLQKKYKYLKTCKPVEQTRTMSTSGDAKPRGAFIVFEGCDKSGKSTQSSRLVEFLKFKNIPVKAMAFPDRQTQIGKLINSYLTSKLDLADEVIHLLFAANRWELHHEIKRELAAGTTLVMDRYSYSGVAYSAGKGMSFEWCKAPEIGLIRPDLVVYLKLNIASLSKRDGFGHERYEKVEFQKKVSSVFDKIYEGEQDYWMEIEASESKDTIHNQISTRAMEVIEAVKDKDMDTLWT